MIAGLQIWLTHRPHFVLLHIYIYIYQIRDPRARGSLRHSIYQIRDPRVRKHMNAVISKKELRSSDRALVWCIFLEKGPRSFAWSRFSSRGPFGNSNAGLTSQTVRKAAAKMSDGF